MGVCARGFGRPLLEQCALAPALVLLKGTVAFACEHPESTEDARYVPPNTSDPSVLSPLAVRHLKTRLRSSSMPGLALPAMGTESISAAAPPGPFSSFKGQLGDQSPTKAATFQQNTKVEAFMDPPLQRWVRCAHAGKVVVLLSCTGPAACRVRLDPASAPPTTRYNPPN